MPTVAYFLGIAVRMFFNDHDPPHFHVRYQGFRARISIADGEIIDGRLPPTVSRVLKEWTDLRRRVDAKLAGRANRRTTRTHPRSGMMIDVIGIRSLGGYRLEIEFSDGTVGARDFSDVLQKTGPMAEPLKDAVYFQRVFIEDGALTWPNGYDWDPIALHDEMKQAGLLRRSQAAE